MKKVLAILLALFMALTLTACGKTDPEPVDPTPQLDPDPEWQWVGEVHPEVTGDLMIYSTNPLPLLHIPHMPRARRLCAS